MTCGQLFGGDDDDDDNDDEADGGEGGSGKSHAAGSAAHTAHQTAKALVRAALKEASRLENSGAGSAAVFVEGRVEDASDGSDSDDDDDDGGEGEASGAAEDGAAASDDSDDEEGDGAGAAFRDAWTALECARVCVQRTRVWRCSLMRV